MAKAMHSEKVFRALLHGGYIAEKITSVRGKTTYTVYVKDGTLPCGNRLIGHITEKQFQTFLLERIIDRRFENSKKDENGNIYYFYYLNLPKSKQ